ncbi:MAG: M20/M25/M40 family metallo-hydrolase [Candidatus Mcinerneyibacterium aminivorans]|uniref:M20/M25/M40 family metallo-hydrolase n=1 Tax=Candidatus Mcinerneyibacterium aminivorans TaxID=2703815 RepID=A0A5D0MB18_9BACT|nr:MAG: M20/M25/M40 family metallo-hydrolase [Candidatus Mcinerneyibacterium aminivorans]
MKDEKMFNNFMEMVKIPSPSKNEKNIYEYLIKKLKNMGLKVETDNTGDKIGSNANNIYAILEGNSNKEGIILSAHMDTVVPAEKQNPHIEGTIIKSDENSVLGGDDKAGIAIILEIINQLKKKKIKHGDIEVVITVAEEIGLLGAKNFDTAKFKNNKAMVFDMKGIDKIGFASIGQKKYFLEIEGRSSHAAMAPEKGINAVKIAADIISSIDTGQLDFETTANVGTVEGGSETNIVPDYARISGEVRSHDKKKINYYINKIIENSWEIIRNYNKTIENEVIFPKFSYEIEDSYRPFTINKNSSFIKNLLIAGKNLNREQMLIKNNGGNDGNIFNEKGIKSVVIGIGMEDVHSKKEKIDYENMKKVVKLIMEYLKVIE